MLLPWVLFRKTKIYLPLLLYPIFPVGVLSGVPTLQFFSFFIYSGFCPGGRYVQNPVCQLRVSIKFLNFWQQFTKPTLATISWINLLPCLAALILTTILFAKFGYLQLTKHVALFLNFTIDDSFVCQIWLLAIDQTCFHVSQLRYWWHFCLLILATCNWPNTLPCFSISLLMAFLFVNFSYL